MTIPEINVQEARRRLDAGEADVYLDVRTVAEFDAGHAPGAVNIPVLFMDPSTGGRQANPEFVELVKSTVPADARIICGCKSGGRSAVATELLLNAGYKDVVNMVGGFGGRPDAPGWNTLGYPTTTEAGAGESYASIVEQAAEEG